MPDPDPIFDLDGADELVGCLQSLASGLESEAAQALLRVRYVGHLHNRYQHH